MKRRSPSRIARPESLHWRTAVRGAECANIEQAEADIAGLQGEAIKRRGALQSDARIPNYHFPTQTAFRIAAKGSVHLRILPSRER